MCWRPPKLDRPSIEIIEVKFVPDKCISVTVKNNGLMECSMSNEVFVKDLIDEKESRLQTTWDPILIPPQGTSTSTFTYEWVDGRIYEVKVMTDKGIPATLRVQAPP